MFMNMMRLTPVGDLLRSLINGEIQRLEPSGWAIALLPYQCLLSSSLSPSPSVRLACQVNYLRRNGSSFEAYSITHGAHGLLVSLILLRAGILTVVLCSILRNT